MDVQRLIGEVARRHNVLVDPSDPIFVTVMLNEQLLAEHLEKVQAAIVRAESAASLATQHQVENARWVAAQVIAEGARQVNEQVRVAGAALRIQLEQVVREVAGTAQAAAAEAARHRRSSRWAAAVALASAFVTVGGVAVFWSRMP